MHPTCGYCYKFFKEIGGLEKHLYECEFAHEKTNEIELDPPSDPSEKFENFQKKIKSDKTKYLKKGTATKCRFCPKKLTGTENSDLRDHKNGHTGNRPYACPLCDYKFMYNSNLKRHQNCVFQEIKGFFPNLHTFEEIVAFVKESPEKFKGFVCFTKPSIKMTMPDKKMSLSKTLDSSPNLSYHGNSHTGNKPHVCPLCDKKFSCIRNLKRHTKRVFQEIGATYQNLLTFEDIVSSIKDSPGKFKGFECPTEKIAVKQCQFCLETFASRSTMREHENSNKGIKPYNCSLCGKSFTHLCEFKLHTKDVFQEIRTSFPNLLTFEDIIASIRKYPEKFKVFKCPIKNISIKKCQFCYKIFDSNRKLSDHENSHTGNKPYACPLCDARFTFTSAFRRHTRQVFQEIRTTFPNLLTSKQIVACIRESPEKFKGFKCARAQKISTKVSDKKCQFCPKTFKASSKLRDHENSHTGNRPHICPICDQSFAQIGSLKFHTKNVFQEIKTGFPNLITFEDLIKSIQESPEKFKHFQCPTLKRRKNDDEIQVIDEIKVIVQNERNLVSNLFEDGKKSEVSAKYSCTLCDEMFSHEAIAYSHEKMHHKAMQNEHSDIIVLEPLIVHIQSQQFLR